MKTLLNLNRMDKYGFDTIAIKEIIFVNIVLTAGVILRAKFGIGTTFFKTEKIRCTLARPRTFSYQKDGKAIIIAL
ncbi:hypothetical protein [Chitinophaga defluvii]|uniref:Uncharacterized protein n=1 Tax=Chitinophaga defluvii TaxID=3163343 RepID=A0ABV2TAW4_9BACT